MARQPHVVTRGPPPRREPPSRERPRSEHVTVGVMMTRAERGALAISAAAAAARRAAFNVELDAATELAAVIAKRVPLAGYHPGGTGESYLEAFSRRLQARLA